MLRCGFGDDAVPDVTMITTIVGNDRMNSCRSPDESLPLLNLSGGHMLVVPKKDYSVLPVSTTVASPIFGRGRWDLVWPTYSVGGRFDRRFRMDVILLFSYRALISTCLNGETPEMRFVSVVKANCRGWRRGPLNSAILGNRHRRRCAKLGR